ncbi:sulfite exporter TauE/SafE family protein [Maridesulfovibrio zosterae]|uniref:sulfite exporter TauE/SafE family protein n=1 Tax=Maridesulfovibrio zosterae TaxID=82171 RepID=UPI0003FC1EDA|nr:sulfite exporter TauE/SafE family protein [Maridesulfovibrio zosterae]
MKNISARHFSILFYAVLILLTPTLIFAAPAFKVPNIIGNVNNPYILPHGGPGFWLSSAIGLVAGLLSSAIGAGGGLIVVPALMTAGISGIYAIGSEIFRLFIFSTIQSVRMGFNKRINYLMAVYLTIGTTLGGYAGYSVSKAVFFSDPAGSDVFISAMIILWLLVYSFIIVPEFRDAAHEYAIKILKEEQSKNERDTAVQTDSSKTEHDDDKAETEKTESDQSETPQQHEIKNEPQFEDELYPDEKPWEIARSIRTMKFPPYIKFPGTISEESDDLSREEMRREDQSDLKLEKENKYERIPVIPAVLLSLAGGFFMALTGSGGVILSFTVLTKGFGCVAALVAGTDLARLALSSGILTMGTYGLNGFVNIYCIAGLIFGTTTGLHMGGKALKHIQPYRTKGLIVLLLISVIINRMLALPGLLRKSGAGISSSLTATLDQSAMYILLIGALIFSGWMLFSFFNSLIGSLNPPEKKE